MRGFEATEVIMRDRLVGLLMSYTRRMGKGGQYCDVL